MINEKAARESATDLTAVQASKRPFFPLQHLISTRCLPEIALIAIFQLLWGGGKCVEISETVYRTLHPTTLDTTGIMFTPVMNSTAMRLLLDLLLSVYQVVLGVALLRMARWAQWGAGGFFIVVIIYKIVALVPSLQSAGATSNAMHAISYATALAVFDMLKYVALYAFLWTPHARQAFRGDDASVLCGR